MRLITTWKMEDFEELMNRTESHDAFGGDVVVVHAEVHLPPEEEEEAKPRAFIVADAPRDENVIIRYIEEFDPNETDPEQKVEEIRKRIEDWDCVVIVGEIADWTD